MSEPEVPIGYHVPGTTPGLTVGITDRGRVLLGVPQLSIEEPYKWHHAFENRQALRALKHVIDEALRDSRRLAIAHAAKEKVTDEMVATATAAFGASDEDGDKWRLYEALGVTGLPMTHVIETAYDAFRHAGEGEDRIKKALLAVAESTIADHWKD